MQTKHKQLPIHDIAVFSMLGALMFAMKIVMEFLPNGHPLGTLTVVYTLVFRKKALYPIYIYVFLNGLYAGFSLWWFPYLYIFTLLWGAVMLLPKRMPRQVAFVVYPLVSALHGILFGILYAPAEALMFGLTFEEMLLWIAAGAPFDIVHAVSNFVLGFFILPLTELLRRLYDKTYR